MPVPAERFQEFRDGFTMERVMPIIIDRYGRKMAEEIEKEVLSVIKGEKPIPDVTYPVF